MSRTSITFVYTVCMILSGAGVVRAAPVNETELKSTITAVTVYADRARVSRQAEVAIENGDKTFAFSKLPGWIDQRSIRASLQPAEAGKIVDVQIKKTFLAQPDSEEIRKAAAAAQEISDKITDLNDQAVVLSARAKHIDNIRAFSLEKLPKDMAVREIKMESYKDVVNFITDSLTDIKKARRAIEKQRRGLSPELLARRKTLSSLKLRSRLEQRTVRIVVKGNAAVKGTLTLTYMLPGATWTPVHEMRAGSGAKTLALMSYAVVNQTTGEDWTGVPISFSTQSAIETTQIPKLKAMLVGGTSAHPNGNRPFTITSQTVSFTSSKRSYSQQRTGYLVLANRDNPNFDNNNIADQVSDNIRGFDVQTEVAQTTFRTLRKRGTTAHFAGLTPQTIRTDGFAVRVQIGTATVEATHNIVAVPDISLNAVRTAQLTNSGDQPLLPGEVAIFLDGAFIGKTETDFVAQGEGFSLFLGVADNIKLSRTLDRKRSSMKRSGRRTRMCVALVITVENLLDTPARVNLKDRIPVSQNKDIKVTKVKILPFIKPDDGGIIDWNVNLKAKERRLFHISYVLDYPANYRQILRANAPKGGGAAGATIRVNTPEQLFDDIQQLELFLE